MSGILAAFGPGAVFIQRTDIPNQTPYNIGKAQSFEYGISADVKELFGEDDFSLMAAVSTRKLTGKIKAATISGLALNAAFYGSTFTAGMKKIAIDEIGTVPSATTYDVTVTNGATFIADNGVRYYDTGVPLDFVTGAPAATGQYSLDVATGKYTFDPADEGKKMKFCYEWQDDTVGQSQIISAQAIGTTPYFRLSYFINTQGKPHYVGFRRAISTKLQHSFKLSDFNMPEIDFSGMQDDSGEVLEVGYGTVS